MQSFREFVSYYDLSNHFNELIKNFVTHGKKRLGGHGLD